MLIELFRPLSFVFVALALAVGCSASAEEPNADMPEDESTASSEGEIRSDCRRVCEPNRPHVCKWVCKPPPPAGDRCARFNPATRDCNPSGLPRCIPKHLPCPTR